ncbi:MAG: 30S ribosomal protein S3 [Candidatus Zambryskibacteria bacterium]|nr:30S ribosomal protein S3 [Candidatus Zambryskibacteria bacterium]
MTHTVHPYSHRLGIIRDWKSRWFGVKGQYKVFLKSDVLIREYLEKKMRGQYVADISMERSEKTLRIIIETSRPGVIIGRNGEGATKLRDEVLAFMAKKKLVSGGEIKIDIKEVRSPETNSTIVAQMIAEGLEKRMPFRRVGKQIIEKVMANRDVLGVKIELSGRLGGASMARQEKMKKGRIPLQTLRADVDYAAYPARLPYGAIGIKVWIYKGEIFAK